MKNLSRVFSAEIEGINARLIEVETDINVGLHAFTIVGLADKALSEAKERVNSALKNIGVKAPNRENRKIVVNLAPADIKKTGSQYDLAIAIGYLLATEQIRRFDTAGKIFVGELALDGSLRSVKGALNIARLAKQKDFQYLFLPSQNAKEAAVVPGLKIIPVKDLKLLIAYLEGKLKAPLQTETEIQYKLPEDIPDFSEIKGQNHAKRALMIAAAGGHNLLMVGPPGTGKSMLAQSLGSILPQLTLNEVIEVTQIYSAAGVLGDKPYISIRPFRSPHQTASSVAIVGGGQDPRPGEISLAHRGILFLDELPEFRRDILEALRQPLENGKAFIARAKRNLVFPARFTLIAAMNPCPCGYYGDDSSTGGKTCTCTAYEVFRYQKKISGPLLDRIDIQITLPRISIHELRGAADANHGRSELVREEVIRARRRQAVRFSESNANIFTNSEMSSKDCDKIITLEKDAEEFIREVFDKSLISPRGYYRILKTARTIADLDGIDNVTRDHLAEAFSYRVREVTM